jgi:hypothetical protein
VTRRLCTIAGFYKYAFEELSPGQPGLVVADGVDGSGTTVPSFR